MLYSILTELNAKDANVISIYRQKPDFSKVVNTYGTVNSIFVEIQPSSANIKNAPRKICVGTLYTFPCIVVFWLWAIILFYRLWNSSHTFVPPAVLLLSEPFFTLCTCICWISSSDWCHLMLCPFKRDMGQCTRLWYKSVLPLINAHADVSNKSWGQV